MKSFLLPALTPDAYQVPARRRTDARVRFPAFSVSSVFALTWHACTQCPQGLRHAALVADSRKGRHDD